MDLQALRALTVDLNFDLQGLDVTVTPPDQAPVSGRGIWVTPTTDLQPGRLDIGRREPRRAMALRRSEFADVPRNTVIEAPERYGGPIEFWKVEGPDLVEAEHQRYLVVKIPAPVNG